jgi:hypothetical protein
MISIAQLKQRRKESGREWLALHGDGQIVTNRPCCAECLKWKRAFSLERVEHDYLIVTSADNHDRMNLFDPINRAEINENDGMMPVSKKHTQLGQRHRVFGSSRESKLPSDINHLQGVSPKVRRAITLPAELTFRDVEAETAQDHSETSGHTRIRGFLLVKRRLRWHHDFLRKASERWLSFLQAECTR